MHGSTLLQLGLGQVLGRPDRELDGISIEENIADPLPFDVLRVRDRIVDEYVQVDHEVVACPASASFSVPAQKQSLSRDRLKPSRGFVPCGVGMKKTIAPKGTSTGEGLASAYRFM